MFFIHLLPESFGMQLSSLLYFTIIYICSDLSEDKHDWTYLVPTNINILLQSDLESRRIKTGCLKLKQTLELWLAAQQGHTIPKPTKYFHKTLFIFFGLWLMLFKLWVACPIWWTHFVLLYVLICYIVIISAHFWILK